ncbi:transposable element Tcb1 transposase [Trichonephila clavipes]|nr:transposable element Tcb1 transposase [Trichonephila clavipes]
MNSEMYVDILDNAALPTLWQYFGEGPFLFHQDNCSIHTSRLAQTWFDEMRVQKLDWPSQSPDLNPIKHLWDELERRLRSQPNRPFLLQALTSAVMDTWKAIPMVTYQKFVGSFPKRLQGVIHAKGGPTSYYYVPQNALCPYHWVSRYFWPDSVLATDLEIYCIYSNLSRPILSKVNAAEKFVRLNIEVEKNRWMGQLEQLQVHLCMYFKAYNISKITKYSHFLLVL